MVTLEVGREQRKPFRERKRVSSVRMEVALNSWCFVGAQNRYYEALNPYDRWYDEFVEWCNHLL